MLACEIRTGWTYLVALPCGERLCKAIEWYDCQRRLGVVCVGTGVPYTVTPDMVVRLRRKGDKPYKPTKDKWTMIAGAYRKAAGSDH